MSFASTHVNRVFTVKWCSTHRGNNVVILQWKLSVADHRTDEWDTWRSTQWWRRILNWNLRSCSWRDLLFCFASSYKEKIICMFFFFSRMSHQIEINPVDLSLYAHTEEKKMGAEKKNRIFLLISTVWKYLSEICYFDSDGKSAGEFLGANWYLSAESWSRRSLMDAEQIEERLNRWSERSTVKDRVKIAAARARFMLCKIKLLSTFPWAFNSRRHHRLDGMIFFNAHKL